MNVISLGKKTYLADLKGEHRAENMEMKKIFLIVTLSCFIICFTVNKAVVALIYTKRPETS